MKSFLEQVIPDVNSSISTELVRDPMIGRVFHFHAEVELTYVERGSGWRFVGEHNSEFKDGELTLIGSRQPHLFRSVQHDSWQKYIENPMVYVVKFPGNSGLGKIISLPEFTSIARMLEDSSSGLVFPGEISSSARPLIKKIFSAKGIKRFVLLLELLDHLACSNYCKLTTGWIPGEESDSRIHRILRFITGKLTEGSAPSLNESASFACMSPEAFSRYFHQKTRKSFIEYVIEWKIGKALRLLRESDDSIASIAYTCGFENLSNFNRLFKKMNNMTPREFRRLNIN